MNNNLEHVYRSAEYTVSDGAHQFVLRIDECSVALRACHAAFGVACSAYVTAWNPGSVPAPASVNERAQVRLEDELTAAGQVCLHGEGRDPAGQWPAEPSLLVPGLAESGARALGVRYRQRAILVAGADAIPRLIML